MTAAPAIGTEDTIQIQFATYVDPAILGPDIAIAAHVAFSTTERVMHARWGIEPWQVKWTVDEKDPNLYRAKATRPITPEDREKWDYADGHWTPKSGEWR